MADELDRRDLAALYHAELDYALSNYRTAAAVAPSSLSTYAESVERARDAFRGVLFPRAAGDAESSRTAAMAAMEREWAVAYGDPNSPETKARIEEACRRLAAPAAKPKRRRSQEA